MIVNFSAHISKWELVCKFGVIFQIFIISCLCSRFHVRNQWFFYSVITFSYIKCFVHSYTVDVVFTLSYVMYLCTYHITNITPKHVDHTMSYLYTYHITTITPDHVDHIMLYLYICHFATVTPEHVDHIMSYPYITLRPLHQNMFERGRGWTPP